MPISTSSSTSATGSKGSRSALGDFAVWCVGSYAKKFREEFQAHIDRGRCPFGGESSIDGVPRATSTPTGDGRGPA